MRPRKYCIQARMDMTKSLQGLSIIYGRGWRFWFSDSSKNRCPLGDLPKKCLSPKNCLLKIFLVLFFPVTRKKWINCVKNVAPNGNLPKISAPHWRLAKKVAPSKLPPPVINNEKSLKLMCAKMRQELMRLILHDQFIITPKCI